MNDWVCYFNNAPSGCRDCPYYFNEFGNQTVSLEYVWDDNNGQWLNLFKEEYRYTSNGHGIETKVSYYWFETISEWVKYAKANWYYGFTNDASLSVDTNALNIGSDENSTATFTIASNTDWTITGLNSWLRASDTTGIDNATITLTAEEKCFFRAES